MDGEEEQKDNRKLDEESTKLYIEIIEKAYTNLKVKYGDTEEFRDLFKVDE